MTLIAMMFIAIIVTIIVISVMIATMTSRENKCVSVEEVWLHSVRHFQSGLCRCVRPSIAVIARKLV